MDRPSNDTERQLMVLSQQWVAAELRGNTASAARSPMALRVARDTHTFSPPRSQRVQNEWRNVSL